MAKEFESGGMLFSVDGSLVMLGHAARNPRAVRHITTRYGSKSMTEIEIKAINDLVDARGTAIQDNAASLNALVDAAVDVAAVNAIDTTTGWPS